jgi:beta-xylosidase
MLERLPSRSLRAIARVVPFACALPLLLGSTQPSSLRSKDFADPYVLRADGTYYAFATGSEAVHVQVARSSDLAAWTPLADALPRLPAWASRERGFTWAPAVLTRNKTFVLYYTARDSASGFQCISRATSTTPEGPYVDDSSRPFVCPVDGDAAYCGSIDPSPFLDANDKPFLLWKSDENSAACRSAPRLWSQPLTDDGLAFSGPATPLLAMDRAWEKPIIEGPSMVVRGSEYFLFYSASDYESANYSVGYAKCTGPSGPCNKATLDAPLLKSAGGRLGPGGQEFFTDSKGDWWMAYHAWTAPFATYASGGARSLHIAHLGFEHGAPVIGKEPGEEWAKSPAVIEPKQALHGR